MQTLNYSIEIRAPKEKVWWSMLGKDGYRKWTAVFDPGSHYEGTWEEGSKMKLLNRNGDGMVSEVVANNLFELVSLMHYRSIKDGIEQDGEPDPDRYPAFEDYEFSETHGITRVRVSVDSPDDYVNMMDDLFPKALQKLKAMCEVRIAHHAHQKQMI